MSCQAQLMEVCQQKKKLEESLRQRERELTALKGALKDEVASHDKEMEELRQQYSADMEKLRGSMEQVSQVRDHHLLLLCFLHLSVHQHWQYRRRSLGNVTLCAHRSSVYRFSLRQESRQSASV